MFELPDRPPPPRSLVERARAWIEWVGLARIACSSLAVIAVGVGGWWLIRPPAVTTESRLPFAGSASIPSPTPATATTQPVGVSGGAAAGVLVVHVAGAVVASGVYSLPAGSRVVDAVRLAGGMAPDANADAVNLAALLSDGQRVYVPRVGEPVPATGGSGDPAAGQPPGPVDINTAGADQLDELPGIGPATAAAIVAYRDQHGPFTSIDQLADVHGIGPAKLAALQGLITV